MSLESAKNHLARWGRDGDVLEFEVSSATVDLAAKALRVEPARIAKSLGFKAPEGALILVTAGDTRVDNKAFKATFGFKAKLLSPEETLAATGHAVGGVCPFGLPETGLTVYLDASMRRFRTVFPACGSANSAIELTCDDLFAYAGATAWVTVCTMPKEP